MTEQKKRGRPATGEAKTPAERKAAQRDAWRTTSPFKWSMTTCLHVLSTPGLTENDYAYAYGRLMTLRGFTNLFAD